MVTYSVDPYNGWAMQLLHEVPGTPSLPGCVPVTWEGYSQSRLGRMLRRAPLTPGPRSCVFNDRRIMPNADLQKGARVKPRKNQTLAPKMMEKEMAEEEKNLQESRTKLQEETKEEEKKFQELTKKVRQQFTEARAALYATGTGSSTTATGTTGQAAATKIPKA